MSQSCADRQSPPGGGRGTIVPITKASKHGIYLRQSQSIVTSVMRGAADFGVNFIGRL